ncbi:MAG: sigma-E processing peptidase SpoIIGA [Hydrogenibacillus sp.]|nr:sigma-E processing peptidase SpoIIGA [Hydrogenibacillus sp.]
MRLPIDARRFDRLFAHEALYFGPGQTGLGRKGEWAVVVYLDLLWLTDLLSDGLALWLAAYALRRRVWIVRLMASAVLMSTSVGLFVVPVPFWIALSSKGLLMLIAVYLAFAPRTVYAFFSGLAALIGAYAVMGGATMLIEGVIAPLGPDDVVDRALVMPLSGFPALGVGYAVALVLSIVHFQPLSITVPGARVKLELFVDDRTRALRALVDTGNALVEPLLREPVGVAEIKALYGLLPEDVLAAIAATHVVGRGSSRATMDALARIPEGWRKRVRIIPYQAIGTSRGTLIAVRLDGAVIRGQARAWYVQSPLMALVPDALSPDGAYDALVHPAWMRPAVRFSLPFDIETQYAEPNSSDAEKGGNMRHDRVSDARCSLAMGI